MAGPADEALSASASARLRRNHDEIVRALLAARGGNPFAAEPDAGRRRERLQAKAGLTANEAGLIDRMIQDSAAATGVAAGGETDIPAAVRSVATPAPADAREKVWGDTVDFVNVSFLAIGARVARAVGRVAFANGQAQGTGFLVGEGLFLTNHHVIPDAAAARRLVVEFDYERDLAGNLRRASRFAIDPTLFLTDTDAQTGLDYTLVAVGNRLSGPSRLDVFGRAGLSDAPDKHMLGEFVNLVQHPDGRFKEVVLRENRLVGRYDDALHYVADTEPGSSGSPVFNSEWQVIALHHWGGPWRQVFGPDAAPLDIKVNEGIRISSIVRHLKARLPTLDSRTRDRVAKMLAKGVRMPSLGEGDEPDGMDSGGVSATPRVEADGRVTFTIPIEVSVRIPGLAPPADPEEPPHPDLDPDPEPLPPPPDEAAGRMRGRGGYKRGFIAGFDVPLPALSPATLADAAPNRSAEAGDDPFELKYHHFSLVMNGRRRMAFFTACNIDGETAKNVNRTTKAVSPLSPDSPGLESIADGVSDAEADDWSEDPRILPSQQLGDAFYGGQKVAGFPNPSSAGRIARMFQKGHLVRRLDPAWGDDRMALDAEQDSFFYTNAAPQVGFFNQGTARASQPGTGGGALWRAVENYVLRNAAAERSRVTSFTGPIFTDADRRFRSVGIPGRFFKVAVWAEAGALKSLAMIADQSQVIEVWPEALFGDGEAGLAASEAFADPAELDKVRDFLSTVAAVEAATGLDFGAGVRDADIRRGERGETAAAGLKDLLESRAVPRRKAKPGKAVR